MKKLASILISVVLYFAMSFNTLAAERSSTNDKELLFQQIQEINSYLNQQAKPIELKEQTINYNIPLSDGTVAKYSLSLTKKDSEVSPREIFNAVLGTWYFDSDVDLPLHGSISVRTTVNITHVPSGPNDLPRFTAYNGTVSAIPIQYTTVTGTQASTQAIYEQTWYETSGYVGFDISGIAANVYFTQTIRIVDSVENYDKIECYINYDM